MFRAIWRGDVAVLHYGAKRMNIAALGTRGLGFNLTPTVAEESSRLLQLVEQHLGREQIVSLPNWVVETYR